MDNFFNRIKKRFKEKDLLIQLILINIAVFLLLLVLEVVSVLFKLDSSSIIEYIGVSSNFELMLYRPWTLLSYMFVHQGFWHILFNMLILYIFGQIFLQYFNSRNLASLYLLGGLAGAVVYALAFNFVPYYVEDLGHAPMIGASASVSAIIFAAAFYKPKLELRFLFIGNVKIIYIALFIFILDFISLGKETNPGGHVAHIGGALMGYLYAKRYLKGKDITKGISKMMDSISNLFKKKPKQNVRVSYKAKEQDYDFNRKRNTRIENIDTILDKIKSSGYSSLSEDEKKRLFDASKK